ncbi:hypothetical protein V1511DRAFT_512472 [Dipodascopsis uninucleata]
MHKSVFLNSLIFAIASAAAVSAQCSALPDYALVYAPYSYLLSTEAYFQSDIATHMKYVVPEDSSGNVLATSVTVNDVSQYNSDVYLTSTSNVNSNPGWLYSSYGIPDSSGYSKAPATIIAVPKDNDIVDIFYFYFYSFNRGN